MNEIFHSVKLIEENCRGCTKCMIKCPVEAVRIKNSRAVIYADRCIDCGECIRVCHYNAHVAQQDSLESIKGYRIKVAIPSITIYTQFGAYVEPGFINMAIESLGFDEVYDMTYACDIVSEIIKKEIVNTPKPAISSFCPGIVRLIQTSYPELIEHVVKVLTPIEVAASLIREKFLNSGFRNEDIGIFYLTPCVARIAKESNSNFDQRGEINGAIAISDIYTKLLKFISKNSELKDYYQKKISFTGLSWAYVGGQSRSMGFKEYIGVDGVENVIKVLDDIENGKFKEVEFVEVFACTEGCLGGILLVDNPFNARRIIRKYYNKNGYASNTENIVDKYKEQFTANYESNKNNSHKFADDFSSAVIKMKEMNRLHNMLPGIDCGQCGSPSCRAFAEDVVRGLSSEEDCKMIINGGEKDEG
ncbi:MAG: 4Fe-4S dicluster protein [Clostridiales bacterium]|jgi:iron only hydrogenase large subunit-like protein|nr:4Fe-4S dicluster protein [Clostridiales bacterium]